VSAISLIGLPSSKNFDPSFALASAAEQCRDTLLELLQDNAIHQQRVVHNNLASVHTKHFVPFEVGFGCPGVCSFESKLSLDSVIELCAGGRLSDVPLKIPHTISRNALSDAVAESFPVLLRGIIAVDDLLPCSYNFGAISLRSTGSSRHGLWAKAGGSSE